MLESIGAQVVYGVVGLKTHAKMLLVTRREGKQLKRYAHLSTGNYNPKTARLYTDISYLTANPMLTLDVENVFFHLASHSRLPKLRQLVLAPFQLHAKMVEMIDALAVAASQGIETRLVAKMNALTDEELMRALIKAGQQGVQIDLIVRGACMLPAQVPGLTDNIRVRSVIGRFLEHSRVFYFRSGEEKMLYLSSADWMNRNMFGRIELAWPVTDELLCQRIIDECLVAYVDDKQDAWDLQADGTYQKVATPARTRKSGAQAILMARYSADPEAVAVRNAAPQKGVIKKVEKSTLDTKKIDANKVTLSRRARIAPADGASRKPRQASGTRAVRPTKASTAASAVKPVKTARKA
jgi:polyphosphate kinase